MSKQKKWVIAIVMMSYFVTAIDCSIIFTGITCIARDLSLNQSELSWVQNTYVLAFGGFMLLGGRLSDALGRKRILNLSLVLFGVGSLMAGACTTVAFMIAARFLQGIGAAILAPTSLALLMDYFEGDERVKAISWYSSVSGLGMCAGLILGGTFASFLSWRYGFYVNVPLTLFMMIASIKVLNGAEIKKARFDIAGTILSVVGVFCFVYAINGARNFWLWITISACLIGTFILIERRTTVPIMPLRLFANGDRSRAYIARILFAGAMMGFYFFISEFLQEVFHFTPLIVGFAFFPLTLFTFLGAMTVPRMVCKWNNRKVLFCGLVLLLAGFALALMLKAESSFMLGVALPMSLIGYGQGLATTPLTNLGIKDVEYEDSGAASGLVNAAHQIGCSIGLSVIVTIIADETNMIKICHTAMVIGLLLIFLAFVIAFLPMPKRRYK